MQVVENQQLKDSYRRVATIAFALLMSPFVYAVGVELLSAQGDGFKGVLGGGLDAAVRWAVMALAFVQFFLSGVLRSRLLGERSLAGMVEQIMVPSERYRRMTAAVLVSLALCESVALFGLLLFVLSGQRADFYPLACASLVFLAIRFPRYHQWQSWYGHAGSVR